MWDSGFFWLFLALFFVFGPFGRHRWGRACWGWHQAREDQPALQDSAVAKRAEEQVLQLETRVAELESRLDFAERLLAQRRDPALPAG